MSASPPIEILLATHNGERFLAEQIHSILSQDYPDIRILARDDGSTDSTPALLADFAQNHPDRIALFPESKPTGSPHLNFRLLMQSACGPYVAFSDQDDVWLPDKLSRSMAAMQALERRHPAGTPLLVFSDLRVVDASLHTIHPSMWSSLHLHPSAVRRLNRLLGRSIVTGCTMLINYSMLELARQMPSAATMHDRWIGLLAASLGASAYLREPTVLYRQHDSNVVGAAGFDNSAAGLARRTRDSSGRLAERKRSERMAEALLGQYRDRLRRKPKQILKKYLRSGRSRNPLIRLGLTLRYGFFRGSFAANLALLIDLFRAPTSIV